MPPASLHSSFWQRRVVQPVLAQLTQGVTPERLALTLALGVACGVFPFLGLTTALCFVVALALRLNQPVIHVVNQLLWPVQLALIVVYIRAGAWLYGAEALPFDVAEVQRLFWQDPRMFWARFGWTGVHALSAWLLSLPVIVGPLYLLLRPALRRTATALASARPASP